VGFNKVKSQHITSSLRERITELCEKFSPIEPERKDNAVYYLQIQNMDLRTAKCVKIDDKTMCLFSTITGEAEKVAAENKTLMKRENERGYFLL